MIELPTKINLEDTPNLKAGFKKPFEIKNDTPERQSEIKGIEFWTVVTEEGFDHYYISSKGRFYNSRNKLMIKNTLSALYYQVGLYNKKNKTGAFIHRLVAKAFIPNPDNKPCVNHIDGNKLNNSVHNLEWCTPAENTKHAWETGLIANAGKLMTEEDIKQMKVLRSQGKEYQEIADILGTSRATVCNRIKEYSKELIAEDTKAMVQMRVEGYSYEKIGEAFGVNHVTALNWIKEYIKDKPEYEYLEKNVRKKPFITSEQVQEIVKLRVEGYTFLAIAEKMDYSAGAIQYHINKLKKEGSLYES